MPKRFKPRGPLSKHERPVCGGEEGALVWLRTTERLIICHRSVVPSAMPSRERVLELREYGWRMHEIAAMFGASQYEIGRAIHGR